MSSLTGEFPKEPTQRRWWNEGYQAAMRDIRAKLDEEGTDGVEEWLKNNTWPMGREEKS